MLSKKFVFVKQEIATNFLLFRLGKGVKILHSKMLKVPLFLVKEVKFTFNELWNALLAVVLHSSVASQQHLRKLISFSEQASSSLLTEKYFLSTIAISLLFLRRTSKQFEDEQQLESETAKFCDNFFEKFSPNTNLAKIHTPVVLLF